MGGQFLGLGEAYIPNLSLLVCLEAFKKFVGFSLSQAEQNFSTVYFCIDNDSVYISSEYLLYLGFSELLDNILITW